MNSLHPAAAESAGRRRVGLLAAYANGDDGANGSASRKQAEHARLGHWDRQTGDRATAGHYGNKRCKNFDDFHGDLLGGVVFVERYARIGRILKNFEKTKR